MTTFSNMIFNRIANMMHKMKFLNLLALGSLKTDCRRREKLIFPHYWSQISHQSDKINALPSVDTCNTHVHILFSYLLGIRVIFTLTLTAPMLLMPSEFFYFILYILYLYLIFYIIHFSCKHEWTDWIIYTGGGRYICDFSVLAWW